MGELAAIAEAFSKYGAWAFVALCLVVIRVLYQRNTALQDARIADVKELLGRAIEAQNHAAHAMENLEEVVKGLRP
jgi:hypothetical protein